MPYVDATNIQYYADVALDEFLNSRHKCKIAAIEIDYVDHDITEHRLEKIKDCDHVLVYSVEGDNHFTKLARKYDLPNFSFIGNCFLNFKLNQATHIHSTPHISNVAKRWCHQWLDWMIDNKLTPFQEKIYYFDVMYGLPRPHRIYTAEWIKKNNLEQYCFQTPFFKYYTDPSDPINTNYNFENSDLWEDGLVPSTVSNYLCHFHKINMPISHVMPLKIYQKTAFSLVCETSIDNDFSFFTEKIAKPIISSRLFIVISGQYYLKNLRALGFQTFDGIIDESYDLEADSETRWNMALEQVKWLCSQDQTKILKSIVPIVLHNRDLVARLPDYTLTSALHRLLLS